MILSTGEPQWHKARRCSGSTCVEVAQMDDRVLIRDSKSPDAGVLEFTQEEWRTFITGVKEGDFSF